MKPLYLHADRPLAVSLDGPALRVSRSGRAEQRFPLCRVSRVMVSGAVSWSTNALLACADAGIAVCFLTADGTPRARWIGRRTPRDDLAQRWQDFLDRPDWRELYIQWRIAASRRAVRICAWRMGWSPVKDPRTMHRALIDFTRAAVAIRHLRTARRRLHGLAQARAYEAVTEAGLNPIDFSTTPLVRDLVTAIQWGLRPELTKWLARLVRSENPRLGAGIDARTAAVFFEQHSGVVDFHLQDILSRLERYLAEIQ